MKYQPIVTILWSSGGCCWGFLTQRLFHLHSVLPFSISARPTSDTANTAVMERGEEEDERESVSNE